MNIGLPRPSLTLLTDLYQITMAYGYWKNGLADREAVFHLFFRRQPFNGGYSIACGLDTAIRFLEDFGFSDDDIAFLATLLGNDDTPLFDRSFLDYLARLRLRCSVDAVAEGTAVFPHEPLLRVTGPLLQCQLLETPLLNCLNFQTLIATKAARVCQAAAGQPVLEFGLRRAQGIDGGLSASRAAYVGGCTATSNVLAGKHFGIPVRGTMAHSWVMAFGDETEALGAYVTAMPNNAVLLVDTHATLPGIDKAIAVVRQLKNRGSHLTGIRIDSGDLVELSRRARERLDRAGFTDTAIVASGDLDEIRIAAIKKADAPIDVWGVGTKMVTAFDQPALDGVYKLGAIQDHQGEWHPRIKVSDERDKTTIPGRQQIRRYRRDGRYLADMIFDLDTDLSAGGAMVDPAAPAETRRFEPTAEHEDLLAPVVEQGRRVGTAPPLSVIRARTLAEIERLSPEIRRLDAPAIYPVGLETSLHDLRTTLIEALR